MTHIVKRGETLGKIARSNGITLAKLLEANPQFRDHPDIIHVGDAVIIPDATPAPPPTPHATPSAFALKLASVAQTQHDKFHLLNEADPQLCGEIRRWTVEIGGAFVSCTSNDQPWSAVFVSWCVKEAGATVAEFKFSKQHSVFVQKAIQNAINNTGVFRGREITVHPPSVGDIIQANRGGTTFDFEHARTHSSYPSHSVIVVAVGQDTQGRFALCIGGNESDSVRQTRIPLTPQGFIRQRGRNPFICVIQNLK